MIIEIKNPIKPITKIPNAETFATSLNSLELGFLRICQTLTHFMRKLEIFPMISRINLGF